MRIYDNFNNVINPYKDNKKNSNSLYKLIPSIKRMYFY